MTERFRRRRTKHDSDLSEGTAIAAWGKRPRATIKHQPPTIEFDYYMLEIIASIAC